MHVRRRFLLAPLLSLAIGCSGGGTQLPSSTGAAGQGAAGSTAGTSGQAGAAGTTGAAGSVGSTGAAGAGSAGTSGAAGAAAGTSGQTGAAGTTGSAGSVGSTGAAGTTGAAGSIGSTGAGGTTVVLTNPGTDGDGDFTVPSGFKPDPANNATGAPAGRIFTFVMKSSESTIYPGRTGAYMRNVWAYVPSQYVPGTAAPFIVVQDGGYLVWFGTQAPHTPDAGTAALLPGTTNLPRVLDNLIAAGKLPKLVALFVDNGGGDAEGSERGLEYDTVSGRFAEFVDQEVVPRVVAEAKTQLSLNLALTKDPQGRAAIGGSSGGAASFSMVWWHPELFARAITFSGTYVRQASPDDPKYPHGCWSYHDYDPYDAAAPNGLVVREPTTKPIRVWLEVGQNDVGAGSGPTSYRDFRLAAQRMAASLKMRNYHYHFDLVMGAGHFDGNAIASTLPGALLWLWRGYPVN